MTGVQISMRLVVLVLGFIHDIWDEYTRVSDVGLLWLPWSGQPLLAYHRRNAPNPKCCTCSCTLDLCLSSKGFPSEISPSLIRPVWTPSLYEAVFVEEEAVRQDVEESSSSLQGTEVQSIYKTHFHYVYQ